MESLLIVAVVFAFLLIVFLVLAFRFPDELKELLGRVTSLEVTKDGLKIALVAEAVKKKEKRKPPTDELRSLVRGIPEGRRVLWVDDAPANNRAEIQALRALGLMVDIATTNAEALAYAKTSSYDLVLSDIGRSPPEEPSAGLALPDALHEAGISAPIAFYTGDATSPTTDAGYPVFDTPTELLRWVRERLGARDR